MPKAICGLYGAGALPFDPRGPMNK